MSDPLFDFGTYDIPLNVRKLPRRFSLTVLTIYGNFELSTIFDNLTLLDNFDDFINLEFFEDFEKY